MAIDRPFLSTEGTMVTTSRYILAASCLLLAATVAFGQSDQTIATIWSGVYNREQAARGKTRAAELCSQCHGDDLKGAAAPALTGPAFFERWHDLQLIDPVTYIQTAMPHGHQVFITSDSAREIVAFMLQQSGVPAGTEPMVSDLKALRGILITRPSPSSR
jgi:mono/diheme cytochrome c family protein